MSEPTGNPSERISRSYAEARQLFLAAATEAAAEVSTFEHPGHRGPDGEALAVDVARVGPIDADRVLLIVSGTHGVEGYAGSALQTHWLRHQRSLPQGVALIMVHALNPYGFAWHRRTNEDNVDLNRNFIDWSAPPPENVGYDEVASLLVPERWDEATQAATTQELLQHLETAGMESFQQTVSGGQYRHVAGVFYGGTGPVWSHRWLAANLASLVGGATQLGIVDLHTGLGPWGFGELIVHHDRADPVCVRAEHWWGDVRSMRDGESVSADLSGDWLGAVEDLVPHADLTAAALEFGTVDPVLVLQALRGEAWLHAWSTPNAAEADGIRQTVRAAFIDDDPAWLAALLVRFTEVIEGALAGLEKTEAASI